MDKLQKVGLTALGTALVSTASFAGDMSVTGSAQITFAGNDNTVTGNGWSMSDTLSFSGSGELDNGWTVSLSMAIDKGTNDANDIKIDMGDAGAINFAGTDGSGPVGAWDDKMPSANEESWANAAGTKSTIASAAIGDNAFTYTNSTMMDGLAIELFYLPSNDGETTDAGGAEANSSFQYGATYTGIDGLTIGYAGGDNEQSSTNVIENTVLYATYAYDAFTVGVQDNSVDQETANSDTDFRAYGVSYAVNDELSVSYGMSEVSHESTSLEDQEASAVSFSYVSGGMTISGSMANVDNVGGTAATDNSGYELNIAFAF
jgi:outer membrane protein OmpU|tara:strand:+ start:18 stop:971 length:954 start_codon:yes stop_codon:yes gene_type:complete